MSRSGLREGFQALVVAVRRGLPRVYGCVSRRPECRACVCVRKSGKAVIDSIPRGALAVLV